MTLWVVTVVKDDLDGLNRTFESIKHQTLQPKWLVVTPQDHSKTWDFANRLKEEDKVHKLLVDSGAGIYAAMNLAVRNLDQKDWVWFLNAGDLFAANNSVKTVENCISRTKHKWIFGGHYLGSDQGEILGRIPAPTSFKAENQLFAKKYVSHQAVVFEVGFLSTLQGFDETYKIAADWDLLVRASKFDSGQKISDELAVFYMGGASTASRKIGNSELLKARRQHLSQKWLFKSILWFVYRGTRNRLVNFVELYMPTSTNRIRKIRLLIRSKVLSSYRGPSND